MGENNKERPSLTTQEAADMLGVTSRTIVRWIHNGRFPGAFLLNPKAFAIPRDEVEKVVGAIEKEDKTKQES